MMKMTDAAFKAFQTSRSNVFTRYYRADNDLTAENKERIRYRQLQYGIALRSSASPYWQNTGQHRAELFVMKAEFEELRKS